MRRRHQRLRMPPTSPIHLNGAACMNRITLLCLRIVGAVLLAVVLQACDEAHSVSPTQPRPSQMLRGACRGDCPSSSPLSAAPHEKASAALRASSLLPPAGAARLLAST